MRGVRAVTDLLAKLFVYGVLLIFGMAIGFILMIIMLGYAT